MSPRPPLPLKHANPIIKDTLDSGVFPPVKYQILNCKGQDILVGRMKIETPTTSGHAFILRRYDTGAVSLTTMFRAAFPNASDAEESAEVQWVKETYDLSGTNGNSRETNITRLAGTWVNPSLALELGKVYKLGALINAVVEANPDPGANYRRSGKTSGGANGTTTTPKSTKPPSSVKAESPSAPNPPKRRKESSPAPAPVPEASPRMEVKVEVKKEKVVATSLRRSNRTTKSPAPPSSKPKSSSSVSQSPVSSRTTKRTVRREVKEEVTPSDETAVDDEDETVNYVAGDQLREQDIAEQKVLIENLKAKRDAQMTEDADKATKRAREDVEEEERLKFDFKEPEVTERAIATNRRVPGYLERLPPERQGLAVGMAAFVFGVGAMFLPTFLS